MKYRLSLLRSAVDDMHEAQGYYDDKSPTAGQRFRDALAIELRWVGEQPLMVPVIDDVGVRRAIFRKFPFGVFFRVEADKVIVFAIRDLRSDAARWKARL